MDLWGSSSEKAEENMSYFKRAAFLHDHRFIKDQNDVYYSEGKLGYTILKRYHQLAENVIVLSRCEEQHSVLSENYAVASGEKVQFTPLKGDSWAAILVSNFRSNYRRVRRAICDSDVVIMRLPSMVSVLAFPICLFLGKEYLVEVVGDAKSSIYFSSKTIIGRYVLSNLFRLYTRLVVFAAKGAIYVTRSELQKLYPNRGVTAFASNVEIECAEKSILQNRLNRIQMCDANVIQIGIIASYKNPYKGIEILLKSVSMLRAQYNIEVSVRLLGSGDSEFLADVVSRNNAGGWFNHEGVLPSERIPGWLDSIDIYCQPSLTEGLPRALIEAMSRACPCVGSRVGGIPELLAQFAMVDPGDCLQLTDKLHQFISSKYILVREANANFVTARDYNPDVLDARRNDYFFRVARVLGA
jgi:glycosyltransferase involved in cell wall biosynthesis